MCLFFQAWQERKIKSTLASPSHIKETGGECDEKCEKDRMHIHIDHLAADYLLWDILLFDEL